MGYTGFRKQLGDFDQIATTMRLKIGVGSPIKQQFDSSREFLADEATLKFEDLDAKWAQRFKEFQHAQLAVGRLIGAVIELNGLPGLKKTLDKVLAGSVVQDFEPSQAKDNFYELEVASDLKKAGFKVALREPDIVAEGNGLSKPLAIACKYPSSRQQVHNHITKGYHQISGQSLDGVVAIGLDLIIGKEEGLGAILQFDNPDEPPFSIAHRKLSAELRTLQEERPRDYPSERPLDGIMLTFTPGGIYGNPAGLVVLNAIALACVPTNPLRADLEIVQRKLEALNP